MSSPCLLDWSMFPLPHFFHSNGIRNGGTRPCLKSQLLDFTLSEMNELEMLLVTSAVSLRKTYGNVPKGVLPFSRPHKNAGEEARLVIHRQAAFCAPSPSLHVFPSFCCCFVIVKYRRVIGWLVVLSSLSRMKRSLLLKCSISRDDIYGCLMGFLSLSLTSIQKMKEQARSFSSEIKQIDLDVNRTFRNHIMFRDRYGVK